MLSKIFFPPRKNRIFIFPPIFWKNWPNPPGESKTRCGESGGINMSPIRANLSDFVKLFQFSKICQKMSKKSGPEMNHFLSFSQRPSPQAPAPRPQKMLQIMLVSCAKVSSRLDKMAPQLCPFEIFGNLKKNLLKHNQGKLSKFRSTGFRDGLNRTSCGLPRNWRNRKPKKPKPRF